MLDVEIKSVSSITERKQKEILQKINFQLEKGNIYSILGKNGSGKSTLIKVLTALLPRGQYVINGRVLFEGLDLLSIPKEKLREIRKNRVRYVFQDAVNSFDPLKKLKYYFDLLEVSPLKIDELLLFFLLPPYHELSPLHSYELSGGMAQRVLIVLSLLAYPSLIILDEPTSGVDYAVTNLIMLKLKELVKEKDNSALIVTQDINFAIKSSDYMAYLSNGTIENFVSPENFMKATGQEGLRNFIQAFNEIENAFA